jgi:hypothetical protein
MMAMTAENQEGDRALARSLAGGMTNSVMP